MRQHGIGTERAVEANGEGLGVADRIPEGGRRLAGERAAGEVRDRARNHHRKTDALRDKALLAGKDRRLGIQRIEDGLDQDDVGAAVDQTIDLLGIGKAQIIKGNSAKAGIVDVRRDRGRTVGRANGASHETTLAILSRGAFDGATGDFGAFLVEVVDGAFHLVIGLRDPVDEKVWSRQYHARLGIAVVDLFDRIRLGQDQKVVIALLMAGTANETFAAEMVLVEAKSLDLRAHGTVKNEDALTGGLCQCLKNLFAVSCCTLGPNS